MTSSVTASIRSPNVVLMIFRFRMVFSPSRKVPEAADFRLAQRIKLVLAFFEPFDFRSLVVYRSLILIDPMLLVILLHHFAFL
jgi:hypothetical protein